MKNYVKPVSESIDLRSVGHLMDMADASNPDHVAPAPKREKEKTVF